MPLVYFCLVEPYRSASSLAAATIGFYRNLFGYSIQTCVIEPAKAACSYRSALAEDGQPHNVEGDLDTIMAGLACGERNSIAWEILKNRADYFAICLDFVAVVE